MKVEGLWLSEVGPEWTSEGKTGDTIVQKDEETDGNSETILYSLSPAEGTISVGDGQE